MSFQQSVNLNLLLVPTDLQCILTSPSSDMYVWYPCEPIVSDIRNGLTRFELVTYLHYGCLNVGENHRDSICRL
jgi:hypothetical protein